MTSALRLLLLLAMVTAAPARPAPDPSPSAGTATGTGTVAGTVAAPAAGGEALTVPAGSPATRDTGGWRAPAPSVEVLRPFAPGPHRWSPGHRGVDLALPAGAPVLAAGRGRVVFAGPVAGRGVVSVAHGALRTTYEPVLPLVRAGDVVPAGHPLGVLDAGHAGCGTCLHWGLRRGEDYLDPLRLLRPPRVRLLPLEGAG